MRPSTILLLSVLLGVAALAGAAENSRAILVRATFASGGLVQNARVTLETASTDNHVASAPGTTLANLYPNYLAPASDAGGLVTRDRIRKMLLGQEPVRDRVAVDFAGNRDGLVDIADFVARTSRRLP